MIELFRKLSGSWLAKLLLGLVVISFAVWGVGDMLRASGSSTVAEVAGEPISAREFELALRRDIVNSGLQGQAQLLDQLNYDQIVLSRLAARKALAIEARRMGFDADDASVIQTLRTIPAFRDLTGAFQEAAYERFLVTQNLRKRDFEKDLRDRVTGDLLLVAVAGGAQQPEAAAAQIWRFRNETRDIAFAKISENVIPEPEAPETSVLEAFHESQAELFTEPERRTLRLLTLTAKAIADPATVEEAAIEERYAAQSDRFNRPERRNLEQIVFSEEAEAKAAAERAKGGEPFTQIAAERGLDAADIALGYVTKSEFAELQPDAAEAAFAAEATDGAIVGPIETDTGWSLLRIAGMQPGESLPLAEVRDALAEDIALEDAQVRLPEIANAVEDRRAEGMTFEEIAAAEPAARLDVIEVDRDGRGPDGKRPEALPAAPDLLAKAFEMTPGEEMDLAETPLRNFYAIEVESIAPSRLRPFEEARDDVLKAWRAQTRRERLREKAEEIAARVSKAVQDGAEPAAALDEAVAGLDAERGSADGLVRGETATGLPDAALTKLFAAPSDSAVGAATAAAAPGGADWVVAVVADVATPDVSSDEAAAEIASLRNEAASSLAADLAGLYQAAVIERLGYVVNHQVREEIARRTF